jgi:hypothetical protein
MWGQSYGAIEGMACFVEGDLPGRAVIGGDVVGEVVGRRRPSPDGYARRITVAISRSWDASLLGRPSAIRMPRAPADVKQGVGSAPAERAGFGDFRQSYPWNKGRLIGQKRPPIGPGIRHETFFDDVPRVGRVVTGAA